MRTKPGDKVKFTDPDSLPAMAHGCDVVEVVSKHPEHAGWWMVRGPDGYEDWVTEDLIEAVKK